MTGSGPDLEALGRALDVPPELIAGVSADGVPDHWSGVRPLFPPEFFENYERFRAEFLNAEFRRRDLPYVAVARGAAEVGPGELG